MLSVCNGYPGGNGTKQLENCFKCAQTYTQDPVTGEFTPIANNDPNCSVYQPFCAAQSGLPSQPGNTISNPNVVDAINTLAGQIVFVPVYSGTQGNGSNATYTLGGFAAIKLDSPKAAVSVGSGSNQTVNLSGTFLKGVGPNGSGTCGGSTGNFGVTAVYLVG
jgi:hypothetical protein